MRRAEAGEGHEQSPVEEELALDETDEQQDLQQFSRHHHPQHHQQQHHHHHQQQQIASEEQEDEQQDPAAQVAHVLGTTPPVLPSPQFDASFSLESMLESSGFGNNQTEKIEKLNEEKGMLDEQLRDLQIRLARAEKKTEEMETKRRSQMLLR